MKRTRPQSEANNPPPESPRFLSGRGLASERTALGSQSNRLICARTTSSEAIAGVVLDGPTRTRRMAKVAPHSR